MTGVTITGLPPASSSLLGDIMPAVQSGVTVGESLLQIRTLFGFNVSSGLLSPAQGGTGVNNASSTLTLSGNLTTTGAFNPTLHFLAGNIYTFPAASQTLLGLGGGTLTGQLNFGGLEALNSAMPTLSTSLATKGYVDSTATGRIFKAPVKASSTTAFIVTYNNGTAGVGATLTNADTMIAFATDGYSASLNDRILFKDQADPTQNGLYTITTVGSGAANWVATRAVDMDQPAEFKLGTVIVLNGMTLAGSTWTESATITSVGTDPITFIQTGAESGVVSISTGTGLTGGPITSTGTISMTYPVSDGGTVTKSLVNAQSAANQTNVTGDGTGLFVVFGTVNVDRNSDYNNTTGTFTAPVTGYYQVSASIYATGWVIANNQLALDFVSSDSANSMTVLTLDGTGVSSLYGAASNVVFDGAMAIKMTAGDTLNIEFQVSGNATKNITINGSVNTHLSIFLIA